ncbi:MAG: ATP-dependent helicase [Deltaproteobacteria bacterium]|nr:ATP-dependent helicase [Deltaproteobacteria bacterium]
MEISEDKRAILAEIEPGAAVIIEGEAGTGKTMMGVLCGQKLLGSMSSWQKVLYLTFSKLAKRQISDCIQRLIDHGLLSSEMANKMSVLNYHSLWWQLITKQYSFLGICQEPLLCTPVEAEKLAKDLMDRMPLDILPNSFLTKSGNINQRKVHILKEALKGSAAVYAQWGPKNFGRYGRDFVGSQDFLLWCREQIFSRNRKGLFSHAETVCWAHSLLTNHPNELDLMREKFPVVIIDEFQDTDVAQWDIIQLLAPKTLIAMADSAQTIHIWRGADPNRIQHLKAFCQDMSRYKMLGTRRLDTRHRAPKLMSAPTNIRWIELKEAALRSNPYKMNVAKKIAKTKCKEIARKNAGNGKTVGILCLTNEVADDITLFFRQRQTFRNKGYVPAISCMRLGADNSPFETARELVMRLLEQSSRMSQKELQDFIANSIVQEFFPFQVKKCAATSRGEDLKERWSWAGNVAEVLLSEFGVGLRELAKFAVSQVRSMNCYCDFGTIGCLKHVGSAISSLGIRRWKELLSEERRRRIDAAVLQYENAFAASRLVVPISAMTIHQSKGREFSVVVIPWFTDVPWSRTEPGWDTSNIEHENLFHTACTRAKEETIVIYPKGQAAKWPP